MSAVLLTLFMVVMFFQLEVVNFESVPTFSSKQCKADGMDFWILLGLEMEPSVEWLYLDAYSDVCM